jgi:next to BRCA1 gene 1 protein
MGDRAGNALAPGERFTKTWRMRNEGSSAWADNTVLAFVGGDQLGAPDSVLIPSTVGAGEEVDISVNMVAPSIPGRYVSYWRLCAPEGIRFGHRVWVDIQVALDKQPPLPASPLIPEPFVPSSPVVQVEIPLTPADQLELEFEHMSVSVRRPIQEPEPTQLEFQPAQEPEPIQPEVRPVQEPISASSQPSQPEPTGFEYAAPVVPEPVYMSPQEAESIRTLRDMGFEGDLLAILRRNKGELLEAVREILGN